MNSSILKETESEDQFYLLKKIVKLKPNLIFDKNKNNLALHEPLL